MSTLPPMTAIRAFEAVARHLSFTRAAEELGMTQAAVSYQIRILEERVGTPLFLRRPRQIALSEAGARLAPDVHQAFQLLRDAFAETHARVDGLLSITTVATFATQWLAQNIGAFQMAHPQMAVRIDTNQRIVDFATEEFDLGIRSSGGEMPGLVSHFLLPADFAPMLSPALAASIGGVHEPADLLKLPMIDGNDPWFAAWFRQVGIPGYDASEQPRSQFGSQTLEAAAAMAGRGVAMLTPAFYRDELASGRLLQPFDMLGRDGRAYYLVYPEARRNSPKIRAFRDWLLPATAAMRA